MAKAKPIDVELIRSLLEYAPEIGGSCLRWKVDRTTGKGKGHVFIKAGTMAGYNRPDGRYSVRIKEHEYMAHRLVWAIVKGEDPQCQIDHINGHEAGNHIENLRLAYRGQIDNQQNRVTQVNNQCGYVGVDLHKASGLFRGRITYNKIQYHLGLYDTPEEAHAAYLEAKARLHTFQPTPRETK